MRDDVPILIVEGIERRVKLMQIRSDWTANQSISHDLVSPLKEGETVFATIKERLGNNEAIVTVRGQDVHVRFQGDMPASDKLVMQVTAVKDGVLEVQAVSQHANEKAAENVAVTEFDYVEHILLAQGIRLTKPEKAALKRFLENARGTTAEKLETVQALLKKKLELTETHLQSVEEALQGEPLGDVLKQLFSNIEVNMLNTSDLQAATTIQTEARAENARAEAAALYGNEEWLSGVPAESKDLIVRTVTEKLSAVTLEFKKLQTEMNRKLENARFLLASGQPAARQQAKPFLEAVINTLDRAILQGEFMLFTDMKTEKGLLQASSKLAEAKQLLANGKQSEAVKIVNEVKSFIEGIRFQPADVKVKHFVSELKIQQLEGKESPPFSQLARMFRLSEHEELSARNMFEQFRQLGLHHEKDLTRALLFKQPSADVPNMKALLMNFGQGEAGILARQAADQAVMNITGQQLLSKFDANSHMQTMFYQLPLLMQDKIETVHVYLNSRNEGGKLDWQNCSLYFLFDTENYGKVGILLQAVERNLTLTIKTDHAKLSEILRPLTEIAKENLETIGYNVREITFTNMSEQKEQTKEMKTTGTDETENGKGYDVVI